MKYFILLIFLSLFSVTFYIGLNKDPSFIPSNLIEKEVPKFTLKKSDLFKSFAREDLLKDNKKIVNFFASWCPPCKIEHPNLLKLSEKVKIYGIAKKDNDKEIEKWFKKSGNPFEKIGLDLDGSVGINWGVYGLPESFLIDEKGFIIYKHVGPIMEKDLLIINKILRSK
tara:strand:- start:1620 stop:2126 length:507 start_codon:yes stop_codon:yes gene_type:complete